MLFGWHQVQETEDTNKKTTLHRTSFTEARMVFLTKRRMLPEQDAIEGKQSHQQWYLFNENKLQQQSLRVMGAFRFGAQSICIREEIPPPIIGGRLFETIVSYFPFPAIPPYYFRNLHFVEHQLRRRQYFMGYNSDGPIIMETLWNRCIFPVGPPILM